jgi:hypothetical protein
MDYTIKCHCCGYDTGIDWALIDPDAPMIYCPECDTPLLDPGLRDE